MNLSELVFHDFVQQTSATTGTGNYVLGDAMPGFQPFADILSTGKKFIYSATDGIFWEIGVGTLQADGSIARSEILRSYSGPGSGFQISAINWGVGTKTLRLVANSDLFYTVATAEAVIPPLFAPARLTTSDNTSQTLYARDIGLPDGPYVLEAVVVAYAGATGAAKVWKVLAAAVFDGETGSLLGTPAVDVIGGNGAGAAFGCTVDVSGTQLRILVTGDASATTEFAAYGINMNQFGY